MTTQNLSISNLLRWRLRVLPTAALVVLAACGGGRDGVAAPAGEPGAPASSGQRQPAPATTAQGAGPVDACALLTAAEVAGLVPQPKAKPSTGSANGGTTYVCEWVPGSSGPTTPELPSVAVSVTPVSTALTSGIGANPGYINMVFHREAEDNDGRFVDGLGDAAKVESVIGMSAEATVVLGRTWVSVEYTGQNGKQKQDAVLDLARKVVARLH